MSKDQIISFEQLKEEFSKSGVSDFSDLQGVLSDFIQKGKIERITRIRDIELDRICQMLFFGVKHTAKLNKKDFFVFSNVQELEYKDLFISSILEYTLINLSLRLSLDSQSRAELKDIVVSLIKSQIEKELALEDNGEK
jgi:hypothetical protein